MTEPHPVTLLVGAGGLLGRGVRASLPGTVVAAAVGWGTPSAGEDLAAAVGTALAAAERLDVPWQVCWAAGAGVTGTTAEALALEVATFDAFLGELERRASSRGTVLLASSAGGIYAGRQDPPYDEFDAPAPTSAYGRAKLETEERLRAFGAHSGHRTVVTRIANLYGPGQNLAKPQGLISHLCLSQLTGTPLPIYVPMDTLRDYLFVTDAARMIEQLLDVTRTQDTDHALKVLASGRAVTIGALVAECARVFRRRPRVLLAVSPLARYQASDLRLRSRYLPELEALATTTLGAGIDATFEDLRQRIARFGLRAA